MVRSKVFTVQNTVKTTTLREYATNFINSAEHFFVLNQMRATVPRISKMGLLVYNYSPRVDKVNMLCKLFKCLLRMVVILKTMSATKTQLVQSTFFTFFVPTTLDFKKLLH